MKELSLKGKKIFIAHSNNGEQLLRWHNRRETCVRKLGYNVETMAMADFHPATIFPYLDKKWKRRDPTLMRLYDQLGQKIADSDLFIHFNGALIHPEFLQQFTTLKVYHCADDPESSNVISRPVAHAYDVHAISNPTCLDLYRSWGCKHVFHWPLGATHYDDTSEESLPSAIRDIPLSFVGSKYGVARWRYLHRIPFSQHLPGLYRKKSFFEKLEQAFPFIVTYGPGWPRGNNTKDVPKLYRRTQVGINLHNDVGAHNSRLFDLAAYGVCQICDNKQHLHHIFVPGKEIVGFGSADEAIELIRFYMAHPEKAQAIGEAAKNRYLNTYTTKKIWENFFSHLYIALNQKN